MWQVYNAICIHLYVFVCVISIMRADRYGAAECPLLGHFLQQRASATVSGNAAKHFEPTSRGASNECAYVCVCVWKVI